MNPVKNCLFGCLLVGAFSMVAAGIYYLSISNINERVKEVVPYNWAVSNWTKYYYPQFEASNFTLELTVNNSLGRYTKILPMFENHNTDSLSHYWEDGHTDLNPYTPLKYEYIVGEANITVVPEDTTLSLTFLTHSDNGDSVFYIGDYPILKEFRHYANQKVCRNQWGGFLKPALRDENGTIIGGSCASIMMLTQLCVLVDYNGTAWEPVYHGEHMGCTHRTGFDEATYGVNRGRNTDISKLSIDIRSAQDPYIEAAILTNDTMYFGLSQGDKLARGIILTVVGALLAFPALLRFFLKYRKYQRSRRYYTAETSDQNQVTRFSDRLPSQASSRTSSRAFHAGTWSHTPDLEEAPSSDEDSPYEDDSHHQMTSFSYTR